MKKQIKICALLLILFCALNSENVNAQEVYYTNDYGVQLTQEEYEFLTKMYWDGYQEIMTQEEYEELQEELKNLEEKNASINLAKEIL